MRDKLRCARISNSTSSVYTGYWRHRAFREHVGGLQQAVSDFYTPRIKI